MAPLQLKNSSSNEYSTPSTRTYIPKIRRLQIYSTDKKLNNNNPDKLDVQAEGVMYLPTEARFKTLLSLPRDQISARAINDAMKAIERARNEDLRGVLPKNYTTIDNQIFVDLLKNFNAADFAEGDVFGKIYEYFLGKVYFCRRSRWWVSSSRQPL